ncbi:MAG: ureidoglycolate lyase [Candidatus Pelagibacter sp.]|nr:ureidoglycolate lyase [Candidatus Pelagibacter sp.]
MPKDHGIIYNKNVWHFPLISLKKMNFLVLERRGKGKNLVEYFFDQKIQLRK